MVEPIRNYYRVVENDGRKELQFVNSYLEPYNGLQPSTYVLTIDVAPDDMKVGFKYYSDNGYEFYSDPNLKDYVTTFYPYYQFLPLRSKSNLSASDLNGALSYFRGDAKSALRDSGSYFKEAEEKYGVNALLLYSMAVHESAWGQSNFALNRNNLFG